MPSLKMHSREQVILAPGDFERQPRLLLEAIKSVDLH